MSRVSAPCDVVESGVVCGRKFHAHGMCKFHYQQWYRANGPTVQKRPPLASVADVFWFYARPSAEPEEHWRWKGPMQAGYPAINYLNERFGGHTFACELLNGPRPERMEALHKCGPFPWCVNPNHLAWGPHVENMADRDTDDTGPRGTRNGRALLSEGDVLTIYHSSESGAHLARLYGVSPYTVSDIKRGRSWAWLTRGL